MLLLVLSGDGVKKRVKLKPGKALEKAALELDFTGWPIVCFGKEVARVLRSKSVNDLDK